MSICVRLLLHHSTQTSVIKANSCTIQSPLTRKQHMNNKLTTGDSFPSMSLTLTDGQKVSIPDTLEPGSYQVILFFRGKF